MDKKKKSYIRYCRLVYAERKNVKQKDSEIMLLFRSLV